MKIYNDIGEIEKMPTVVTVGAFDGLHVGHGKILETLQMRARDLGARPLIITFNPHPQIVLKNTGRAPVKILTAHDERMELFESYGAENVLIINFTPEFSRLPADVFIRDYLVNKIGCVKIIIGYDHLFGKNREGNEELLAETGRELGFTVEKVGPMTVGGTIVSSTKIRTALSDGRVRTASTYLGYNYAVSGKVILGEQLGRKLGYPTANIDPEDTDKLYPKNGIYLVRSIIEGREVFGQANLGNRPTVTDSGARRLEVNYLDFSGDLYGKTLRVEFLEFLRDEKRFSSIDELVTQIRLDEEKCRMLIN